MHRELGNAYAFLTFKDVSHFTTQRAEEKMAFAYSLTLGKLVEELKDLLPDNLYKKLDAAVEKRNILAHHFWFERIYKIHTEEGILSMIAELGELTTLFSELDEEVQSHFSSRWVEFGITPDLLESILEKKIASGNPNPALANTRKLQKIEEVINVWYAPLKSGGLTLLFQTIDNCLWQLCDVGLGWTNISQIDSNWKTVEKIQKYLPARINPRPKNSLPWNYEFDFGKGVLMWVKKNEVEKSFKWGIRVEKMK